MRLILAIVFPIGTPIVNSDECIKKTKSQSNIIPEDEETTTMEFYRGRAIAGVTSAKSQIMLFEEHRSSVCCSINTTIAMTSFRQREREEKIFPKIGE